MSYLTEELVHQGHEVTLFASGDSCTRAELVPIVPQALRLDSNCIDQLAPHLVMIEKVLRMSHRFDIVHFHIDYLHFPFTSRTAIKHVTTLHGKLTIPELPRLYDIFPGVPVVSISDAQRLPLPKANWQATVYPRTTGRRQDRPEAIRRLPRVSRSHLTGEARRSGH